MAGSNHNKVFLSFSAQIIKYSTENQVQFYKFSTQLAQDNISFCVKYVFHVKIKNYLNLWVGEEKKKMKSDNGWRNENKIIN